MRKPTRQEVGIFLVLSLIVIVLIQVLWPEPLDVDTAQVQQGPLEVTIDNEGEARSRDRYVVSAPISGRLLRMEVRAGDPVVRGEIVAWMIPAPLNPREAEEARARLLASEALQAEAQQRWHQAQSAVSQAKRDHLRVRELVQQGFMSAQAEEQASTALQHAEQEEQAVESRWQAAKAQVLGAQASLAWESRVPGPQGFLPQPIAVRAPIAAKVLSLPDPSERVVLAGSPLLTLGPLNPMEVAVEVLSSEAVRIQPGMPVQIEGWGGPKPFRAVVRAVEPYAWVKVSSLGVEEKRARVLADFIDTPTGLGDGFRVTARVVVWSSAKTLQVDTGALFRCDLQWCVFVIDRGRAARRTVDVGEMNSLQAQVLAGLRDHETVIRYPGNQVQEGVRVRPLQARRGS